MGGGQRERNKEERGERDQSRAHSMVLKEELIACSRSKRSSSGVSRKVSKGRTKYKTWFIKRKMNKVAEYFAEILLFIAVVIYYIN